MEMSNKNQDRNLNTINDEEYKENLRNISKFYVTKNFNSALELCEKCLKFYKVENTINIFEIDNESIYASDDEYYVKKNQEKQNKPLERSIIPLNLVQIYLKIIEQIKPDNDCWDILNKYYKDVKEIPSTIVITR